MSSLRSNLLDLAAAYRADDPSVTKLCKRGASSPLVLVIGAYGPHGFEIQATGPSLSGIGPSTHSIWKQPTAISLGVARAHLRQMKCSVAWAKFRDAREGSRRAWRSR